MLARLVLVAALIVTETLSAGAQAPPPNLDRLKRTLEKFAPDKRPPPDKKFAPESTRGVGGSAPESADRSARKREFQWIDPLKARQAKPALDAGPARVQPPAPGGAVTPPPPPPPGAKEGRTPGLRRFEASQDKIGSTWWSSVYKALKGSVGLGSAPPPRQESHLGLNSLLADSTNVRIKLKRDDGRDTVVADNTGTAKKSGKATITAAPTAPPTQAVAPADVPVAKRNSFVIQLKPDASEEAIAKLLGKYNLNITKIIAELGVITVEIAEDDTRGLAPEAPAAAPESAPITASEAKKNLEQILEPEIIKALRNEPIVDAAIVNSTIGTKALPKPSRAMLDQGGKHYGWSWAPGDAIDGNWAMKSLRMPPVWTILDRYRKRNPGEKVPKIGIIDAGFADNPNVPFQSTTGVQKLTVLRPDCNTHHAMHVAGIIGARQGEGGINGMVPDARLDAIAISNQATNEAGNLGVEEMWEMQTLLFDEVLGKTMDYLVDNVIAPDNLRVINISLGYNFLAKKFIGSSNLDDIEGLKLHIHHQANIIRRMAQRVEDKVLFVVAAGNDSDGLSEPLPARWASPFAWAGTYEGVSEKPARNILVVEANDRNLDRAAFSNAGGHVSAPGVDIMSTLVGGNTPYAVCSGTSQAAPFVSSLAAILFELDPTKTPAEVIDIIKATATTRTGGAPAIDALEAVLALPGTKAILADLDEDGQVGPSDLMVFKAKLGAILSAATAEKPFETDLNGDGVVDENECRWPVIDLNGSGSGATQPADFVKLSGLFRSDLSVLALAWSDTPESYQLALETSGLKASSASDTLLVSLKNEPPPSCLGKSVAPVGETIVATAEPVAAPPSDGSNGGSAAPAGAASEAAAGGGENKVLEAEGGDKEETGPALGLAPAAPAPATPTPAAPTTGTEAPAAPVAAEGTAKPESRLKAMVRSAIEQLKALNPRLRITLNPATGLPASITGFLPRPGTASLAAAAESVGGDQTEDETRRAVEGFFAAGGLTAAFPTQNKSARTTYVGRRRDPDFPDRYIATVEQRVGNVPVFGSSAKLTVDGLAGVTKYVGTPSQVAITDMEPQVAEADAIAAAAAKLVELNKPMEGEDELPGGHGFHAAADPNEATKPPTAQLIVYDPGLIEKNAVKPTRLAWLVQIDDMRLFVDAKTGEVFHYYLDRQSGSAPRKVFDLEQGKTFPGKVLIDEETFTHAEDLPEDARLAFRYTGDVRDFFSLVFGRNSFDDNDGAGPNGGAALKSFVRYASIRDAFWCPSKSYECPDADVMVFGPGYANSIDIVGHEMTHGIIAHEKNLLYLNEPGAVNESLADIFGTLIELWALVPQGNWLIGEHAQGFSEASPLRSLADPKLTDADGKTMFDRSQRYSKTNRGQPDSYEEVLTREDTLCGTTRYQDNGCVHFNSGILNKFAYLISEGGEHRGVTVTGIGRFKLARIAYRTMTAQLNESSGLIEAADGFALSCLELAEAGDAGIGASDCEQVMAAQQAVGLTFGS